MGLALWVRLGIAPVSAGLQYVTFFPAVTLAAIAGGYRAGLLATAIGLLFATYIFTPPYFSISIEVLKASLWSNMVFLTDGIILSISIEAMHRYREKHSQELKKSIEAHTVLEGNTRHIKKILDNLFSYVALLDTNGVVQEVNRAPLDRAGLRREDVVGQYFCDAPWWTYDDKVQSQLKDAIEAAKQGITQRYDVIVKMGDDFVPIDFEISPVRDENGLIIGLLPTAVDITERKKAEKALRESENKFHILFESATDCLILLSEEGRIMDINRIGHERLGYAKEEMLGRRIAEFDPPEFASRVPEHFAKIMRDGQATFESVHVCKNGSRMPVEVSCRQIELNGEKILFSTIRDITERKKIEESLRVAAVAFETQEAILITDQQANIIRVNQAFTNITGYRAEEVLGQNPRILSAGRQDKAFYVDMWQQLLHHGSWSGEIWEKRKNGQIYPKWLTITAVKNELQETTHYVSIFSDITVRKQTEEEIRKLAFYDALTKLPNRRLFLDRFSAALAASVRRDDYGAVLFIDLDRFKALNDTLGHDYGDLLLIEVGVRIKSCVREMDTVARFGGDEFVVLIESISNDKGDATHKVSLVAEKIREALARIYELRGHEHHSSPSIGISLYHGHDESIDVLIEHADMAMYQAKESGRNAVRFFDPIMQKNVAAHDALDNDLHYAIELQQLHLHYQIQVDNDNHPLGAEAFLRWKHPERGIIMPGQFIQIAEESDLIIDIGRWVLQTACHQLALWSKNEKTRDLTLTVNISAKQFALPDFVSEVVEILKQYQADPTHLKLELSERLVMTDMNSAMEKIHTLRNLGVRLSMDNFGTVYSSLSFLKQLSSDQLKIHQEFVKGITHEGNDAQLIQAVIDLAKSMDLDVFAEGVETEEQRFFLKSHDCNSYQGYLFGKPVSIEEFDAAISQL